MNKENLSQEFEEVVENNETVELSEKEKVSCLKTAKKMELMAGTLVPVILDTIKSVQKGFAELEKAQQENEQNLTNLKNEQEHKERMQALRNFAEERKLAKELGLEIDIYGTITVPVCEKKKDFSFTKKEKSNY